MDNVPRKITLTEGDGLDRDLMLALGESAKQENRSPKEQAVVLLRAALGQMRLTLVVGDAQAERLVDLLRAG